MNEFLERDREGERGNVREFGLWKIEIEWVGAGGLVYVSVWERERICVRETEERERERERQKREREREREGERQRERRESRECERESVRKITYIKRSLKMW